MFPSCHCRWQHGREKLKAAFALVDAGLSPTKAAFRRKPISDYLRITVGTDAQIDRLLSTLSEIFGGTPTTPP